jgi:hypothetical protein
LQDIDTPFQIDQWRSAGQQNTDTTERANLP